MQRWEYRHLFISRAERVYKVRQVNNEQVPDWEEGVDLISYLNSLGEQGWEVITVVHEGANLGHVYLKRLKS